MAYKVGERILIGTPLTSAIHKDSLTYDEELLRLEGRTDQVAEFTALKSGSTTVKVVGSTISIEIED